jgi:hypothetical protein
MTVIARALSRALPATQTEAETLKTIVMFCGIGLVLSLLLLLAIGGADIGAAFL